MTDTGRAKMVRAGRRRGTALVLLALTALLGQGCAGSAVRAVPQARLEAIKHNQRGVDAELKGNQDAALQEFSEALRLHSSIENWDGMVVAQINIARTQRLKGNLKAARTAADRALSLQPHPSDLAAELFFENAKIHLATGDLAAAKEWSVKAAEAEKGDDLGRRLNLVAGVLLRSGAPDQARGQAEKALKANRDKELVSEEANSLRLLGEINLMQRKAEHAADCFERALVLDKKLGLGRKIALDLRGLGRAASQREDLAAAMEYYRRALEVSRAGHDEAAAAEDMAKLAELSRRSGDARMAQMLDEERAKLLETGEKRP